jgi:hypothetical protein
MRLMATHTISLDLPEEVLQRLERTARRERRSVTELAVESIVAANPEADEVPAATSFALAQMVHLNDAALWQAARTTLTPEQRERLQELHDLEDVRSLSPDERREEQALLDLYHETLQVRAQAARLLGQRGYDLSDPTQFSPLE